MSDTKDLLPWEGAEDFTTETTPGFKLGNYKDNVPWRVKAERLGIDPNLVLYKAGKAYMANWKELPNHRFPPVWANASTEVKDWMCRQALAILSD